MGDQKLLIAGIDPGTTTGYAILDLNGNLIANIIKHDEIKLPKEIERDIEVYYIKKEEVKNIL